MVRSHLRFAAGVGVLVAALWMGAPGAAVAFAKPPSSDSTADSGGGAKASDHQPSTGGKKLKETPGGTDTKKGQRDSSQQPSTGTTSQTNPSGGTDATEETTDSGPVAGATTSVTGVVVAAVPNVVAPAPTAAAPASDVELTMNEGAPVPDVVVAAPDVEPAVNGVVPVPDVPDVVAPAPDVEPAMPVPDVVTPVPAPVASVSVGIAWVQDMFTLAFGTVVPLTQLQSDLYSFLMGIAGAAPVVEVSGGFAGAGLSAGGHASVASQGPLMAPLAAIRGVAVAGNAARVARLGGRAPSTFGAIEIGRKSSLPRVAPLVPDDAIPMGEQSSFGPAGSDLLLPASQSALAAGALSGSAGAAILAAAGVLPLSLAALARIALPGAGGLLTLTGTGVRLGYRQAKAGFALRTAGIASFARSGAVPLGVVRPGSLVVVRPRALRVVRPGALSADHLLDRVA